MQKEMNDLFEKTQKNLDEHAQHSKRTIEESATKLMRIKNASKTSHIKPINQDTTKNETDTINWEVEYEE